MYEPQTQHAVQNGIILKRLSIGNPQKNAILLEMVPQTRVAGARSSFQGIIPTYSNLPSLASITYSSVFLQGYQTRLGDPRTKRAPIHGKNHRTKRSSSKPWSPLPQGNVVSIHLMCAYVYIYIDKDR